ncbi:MAG: hypothetical protein AAB971_00040 [Patescibacteria group bacterium]
MSTVEWEPVTTNPSGLALPWPTIRSSPESVRDDTSTRSILLTGYVQGGFEVDTDSLVWCGFPAQSTIDAATFGRRRSSYAVTTEEMEHPRMLSHNPASYAFRSGIEALPGVAALRRECFWRNRFLSPAAYLLKPWMNFDDAVAALLVVDQELTKN